MSTKNYVDWTVFEDIPAKSYEISFVEYTSDGTEHTTTIEKSIKKFICQAPVGSGKVQH